MRRVMLVDDQNGVLVALSMALRSEYEISTAASGEECLKVLPEFKPELVLADYKMPGMDGLELISVLVGSEQPPKVVLFSAMLTNDLVAQAKAAGAVACLPKPFDLWELKSVIEKVLGK